jgi:hypothetical protein
MKILATNLVACKLFRKFCKEEEPTRVLATTAQCSEGILLSWAPYLLNLFLDDFKDAKELRIEFHYSWLIILIALVGWEVPKYIIFYPRAGKCCATKYVILWNTSATKERMANSSIFSMYFDEMREKVDDTWRIPPEGVEEHKNIDNF